MARALPPFAEALSDGIVAIDTGFHRDRFDAAYLIVDGGRAAFVDTGTNFAVPRLLETLQALELAPDAVDWVIPTHVHLDHAGGVGALMQSLPRACVWAHPRGAPHLVDPARLYEGALAVYGQAEMDRSYGRLIPVDAARMHTSDHEPTVMLGRRTLRALDTPGHARHHHCIWDERSRGWFTGDTFGLSYREFDTEAGPWILPTSTPVQFDPDALLLSIQRLLAEQPRWIYLTHFGRVGDVPRLGAELLTVLDGMVAIGRRTAPGPDRHDTLKRELLALYLDRLQRHGCARPAAEVAELLAIDLELNAQGMAIWLDREAAAAKG